MEYAAYGDAFVQVGMMSWGYGIKRINEADVISSQILPVNELSNFPIS